METEEFETPWGEDCVQVSSEREYLPAMKAEYQRLKTYLETRFPGLTGTFSLKLNAHDFGGYYSLRFRGPWEEISHIEENYPERWDELDIFPWEGESELTFANALDA